MQNRKMMKLYMILLAAGNGRRFGGNKLLQKVGGKALYRHTLDNALAVCKTMEKVYGNIIMVSQYEEILKTAEKEGCTAVRNLKPQLGISYSIQLGLEACMERQEDLSSYMFFVCDQPWLEQESIERLIEGYLESKKPMASMEFDGIRGNPCIFDSVYLKELLSLQGDQGGRYLLNQYAEQVEMIQVGRKQELKDIDHATDLC